VGGITALVLPPTYVSTSVILIENQMIPQEYVQTTITSFVEERLAAITQQVMSRSKLMEIIEKFNLYEDMREKYTSEEIIEEMRENIHFEPRTAGVIDRRTGRPTEATIYFTLAFEGEDPVKVQKVANVLASLYLELNLKTRERLASNTTLFLDGERKRLQEEIDAYDNRISQFKKDHLNELPEYSSANMQGLQQFNNQIERLNIQISSLKDRKILLEGQLAVIDPLSYSMTADGKNIMSPGERLKYLRLELISMGSRLSKDHPDYVRIKKEIVEMEKQTASSGSYNETIKRLKDLEAKLAEATGKMGEKHPDVIALKKEINGLKEKIAGMDTEKVETEFDVSEPDNPSYINLMTQITAAESEIAALMEQKKYTESQIEEYEKRLINTPAVERDYNKLLLENAMAKNKYTEINNKLMEAEVAQGMESTQRGERFTIIDPAQLPEKPDSPNRLAIILIGFVLALGAGTGIAAINENLDSSVKSREELQKITGVPVFSVIDRIETEADKLAIRKKRIVCAAAVIAVITLGTIAFHNFVMPLEVFEAKLSRKIDKL
ncbi:MAG: hypothetical protein PVG39_16435, partial [Desulfobacteraceae bacterium]